MIRPFGSTFMIVPTPPTNVKKKIPLQAGMTFEMLRIALLYDMPMAELEIVYADTGK